MIVPTHVVLPADPVMDNSAADSCVTFYSEDEESFRQWDARRASMASATTSMPRYPRRRGSLDTATASFTRMPSQHSGTGDTGTPRYPRRRCSMDTAVSSLSSNRNHQLYPSTSLQQSHHWGCGMPSSSAHHAAPPCRPKRRGSMNTSSNDTSSWSANPTDHSAPVPTWNSNSNTINQQNTPTKPSTPSPGTTTILPAIAPLVEDNKLEEQKKLPDRSRRLFRHSSHPKTATRSKQQHHQPQVLVQQPAFPKVLEEEPFRSLPHSTLPPRQRSFQREYKNRIRQEMQRSKSLPYVAV
jgi:hypothetical protein